MSAPVVTVHGMTEKPTILWEKLSAKQHYEKVKPMSWDTPLRSDALRCIAISDTHSRQVSDASLVEVEVSHLRV